MIEVKNITLEGHSYPWSELEVGQGFNIPEDTTRQNVLTAAQNWAKRNGKDWKFKTGKDKKTQVLSITRIS